MTHITVCYFLVQSYFGYNPNGADGMTRRKDRGILPPKVKIKIVESRLRKTLEYVTNPFMWSCISVFVVASLFLCLLLLFWLCSVFSLHPPYC